MKETETEDLSSLLTMSYSFINVSVYQPPNVLLDVTLQVSSLT